MSKWGETGTCWAKKGLLFLRTCGEFAVAQCHVCGCPVCSAHQVFDATGTICPECFASHNNATEEQKHDGTEPGWRERYYEKYGYTPISLDFGDDDHESVEKETSASASLTADDALETHIGTKRPKKKSDDLDDYLES